MVTLYQAPHWTNVPYEHPLNVLFAHLLKNITVVMLWEEIGLSTKKYLPHHCPLQPEDSSKTLARQLTER